MFRPLLAAVLMLSAALPALAADVAPPGPEAAIELTLRRFYSSDAALNGNAPGATCAVEGVRLLQTKVDGDAATVHVEVAARGRGQSAGGGRDDHRATVTLRREGGTWSVSSHTSDEDELARRIVAAEPARMREALAAADPALLTGRLGRALSTEATTAINRDRHETGRVAAALALDIARDSGDIGAMALALSVQSVCARRAPPIHAQRSNELALEALELAEQAGEPDVLAKTLLRAGRARHAIGESGSGYFTRIMDMAEAVEDASTMALAATQLGLEAHLRSDVQQALRWGEVTRAYAARSSDPLVVMQPDLHLAGLYLVADCTLASFHAENALRLARAAGYEIGIASSLAILAHCHDRAGRRAEFIAVANEAIERYGDAVGGEVLELLRVRARHYVRAGDCAAARLAIAEILRYGERGGVALRGDSLRAAARVWVGLGEPQEALKAIDRRAFHADQDIADAAGLESALALRQLGFREEAYRILLELARTKDVDERWFPGGTRQQQLGMALDVPRVWPLLEMLAEDGRAEEAAVVADEAKGRTLLNAIGRGIEAEDSQLAPEVVAERRALERRVSRLKRAAAAATGRRADELEDELRRARVQLESLRARIAVRAERPEQKRHLPLDAREMQTLAAQSSVAFVEFTVMDRQVHAAAVTATGVVTKVLRVTPAELEALTGSYTRRLAARAAGYGAAARELYDLLLAPLWPHIAKAEAICVIPDGPLWELPFQTLIAADGEFIVEKAAVFYAPSIATFAALRRERTAAPASKGALLAAANAGDLPDAEREVLEISRLYGQRPSFPAQRSLSEQQIRTSIRDHRVLHIATHGVLDDTDPMFSHLVFARDGDHAEQDGFLEAWEIARLRLDADLAVLSACDTGRGAYSRGDGVVGMSWAFIAAGVSATVVSQWKVESSSTADLMIAFHKELQRNAPAAEALRRAQVHMLRDDARRHPFYWAAFTVFGDGLRRTAGADAD